MSCLAHGKHRQSRKRNLRRERIAKARVRVKQKKIGKNRALRERENSGDENQKRNGQENRARNVPLKPDKHGMRVQRNVKRRKHKNPTRT